MIIKAFNQEFNINIKVNQSVFNEKIIKLISANMKKRLRTDLLTELNEFIKEARKQYDAVNSEARKQYDAVKSEAWKQYDAVESEARKQYDAVKSEAWKQYDAVESEARKQYNAKILKKLDELIERI